MSFYNLKNYLYLLQKDCSIVITGDSLAYNRYDFIDEPRMNAWDCPLAMRSWSFMLRDYLIGHSKNWCPASNINYEFHNQNPSFVPQKASLIKKHDQRLPLTDQLPLDTLRFDIQDSDSAIQLKGCPEDLCFITNPKAALFESDGLQYDLSGNTEIFSGTNFKWGKSKSGLLKNIKEGSLLNLAGAADAKTEVFMTGSGSKTVEWMLENSYERIYKYKPDLCILIIGANNRRMNNPKSFKAALHELLANLKKKKTEVILISPPHSTTSDPQWGQDNKYNPDETVTKPIMDVLIRAAFDNNIPFINLFEFFSGIPNSKWRFDNTHFNKEGNLMLFKAIIENFFKE